MKRLLKGCITAGRALQLLTKLMLHAHQHARAWKYMCVRARIHWVLHPIFMHARKKRTNPRTRTLVRMRH